MMRSFVALFSSLTLLLVPITSSHAEPQDKARDSHALHAGAGADMMVAGLHRRGAIQPVHPEMTFQDYQDAHRTKVGGIPWLLIPGGLHFYADESRDGWLIAGTAAAGIVSIIIGASMGEPGEIESEHEMITFGEGDDAVTYAKVPERLTETGTEDEVQYRLERLEAPQEGTGTLFVILGSAALAGAYIFDLFHGMNVIELKRDRARYKYGKLMYDERGSRLKVTPRVEASAQGAGGGLNLQLDF